MKTPRIFCTHNARIWLSLLCTSAMLLTACGGGAGGGANGVAGSGLGLSNISVNGMLAPAQVVSPTVTTGSDDAALIQSQSATAPKTLETISFALGSSNSNAKSVKWQFGSDANDVVGGGSKQIQTAVVGNDGTLAAVSAAFKTTGIKTVTSTLYSSANGSGTPLSTETIRMYVAGATVIKTASITGASSGNAPVSNGGEATGNSLTLSGTYSSDLGTDYSVQVFDGASALGTATPNTSSKTWTYSINSLTNDSHSFTALVKRTSDSVVSKPSDAWIVKKGNTVAASNSSPSAWDEFTLTLNNVWNNVKSVVFTFSTDKSDMADGMTTQTASFVSNAWQTVTTAFKTTGTKTITADFKSSDNATVTTRNITVNVGTATVTQTATITDVKDGNSTIPGGGSTVNTKPTISGSFSTPLNNYYSLKLYDNNNLISDTNVPIYTLDNNKNKTAWSFTPASAFSYATHTITAKVVRLDGVEGDPSAERTFTVSRYSQVAKAGGFYDKTECVKDNSTGLMWEGKPANGTRGNPALDPNGRYTYNLNDTSNTNALGYINAVNVTGLCGFKNWRLPTKDELSGIVANSENIPTVDETWFPNTKINFGSMDYFYWTLSPDTSFTFGTNIGFLVGFYVGYFSHIDHPDQYSPSYYVRLVR